MKTIKLTPILLRRIIKEEMRNMLDEITHPKSGTCRKCGKRVQLDAGGLVDFHKVPGDNFNTCPGSKDTPEEETSKKQKIVKERRVLDPEPATPEERRMLGRCETCGSSKHWMMNNRGGSFCAKCHPEKLPKRLGKKNEEREFKMSNPDKKYIEDLETQLYDKRISEEAREAALEWAKNGKGRKVNWSPIGRRWNVELEIGGYTIVKVTHVSLSQALLNALTALG